ncbi:MAG: penicillin-binding protein 2 [Ectothiorhodospiraceae bacterium]|nr:penicillin-binding protein 2 [Ectothiorhodospiraceae bacterium]
MALHHTIKDHFRETRLFTSRAVAALLISIGLMAVLLLRLFDLQVIKHDTYAVLSDKNRIHIRAVPPTRGLIYDRNGTLLAENLPSYRLEVIVEQVKDLDATIAELRHLVDISDDNIAAFKKRLKRSKRYKPVSLRSRLSDEEVARFAVNRHRFPGVDTVAHLYRHYPFKSRGVHAVGYVGRISEKELHTIDTNNYEGSDFIGKTGIERFYEDLLHGEVGVERVETNAQGRTLRVLDRDEPVPGLNIYLSLDAELQGIAEAAMGDNNGAVVAIDPTDGSVLALASMPTFNPNLFVGGIDTKTYRALQDSPDQPMFNRAIRGRYPPGSTVKPFIGLAGLEYGLIDPDISTYCQGWYMLDGDDRKYRDWKKTGHGHMDLNQALVESCDVYFYDLALTLGIDRLSAFLEPFGFSDITGIDISGELTGLVPTRQWKRRHKRQPWYPGETLITGIGQGFFLSTPLQLATATAALSHYGSQLRPRLVAATEDPNSREKVWFPATPNVAVPVGDIDNWSYIIRAMTRVVHSRKGTARRIAKGAQYKIAGKTGTSQVFGIKQDEKYVAEDIAKKLRDHALFIGFAPVDDPRIAIAVIVENGGSGGAIASPIARKVMDYYLNTVLPREAGYIEQTTSPSNRLSNTEKEPTP